MIVNYAVSCRVAGQFQEISVESQWLESETRQFQESSVESQWLEFGTRVRLCSPRIGVTLRGNEPTLFI